MRTINRDLVRLGRNGIALAFACTMGASAMQKTNSSVIDADGTAHVTRVVPVPKTISPQAQAELARPASDTPNHDTIKERRAKTDHWQAGAGVEFARLYPGSVQDSQIAGVPVRIITPANLTAANQNRVLINVHGGGFTADSGSLTETIPIASLTHTKVIAILYRLAPEHPYPAAVDDTIAVYKELLKTYKPADMVLYGTSAGAILTAESAVRMKETKLPLPAALGIFSGLGDYSQPGDSNSIYALAGLSGHLPVATGTPEPDSYVGSTDPKNPGLSPLYADLHGLPPTLFLTSTRDVLLSGTTILHRAFLRADVPAELVVFEALPHAFWNNAKLPETTEANQLIAKFFSAHLAQ